MKKKFGRIVIVFLSLFLALVSSSVLSTIPPPASRVWLFESEEAPPSVTKEVYKTGEPNNFLSSGDLLNPFDKITIALTVEGLTKKQQKEGIEKIPIDLVLVADISGSMLEKDAKGVVKLEGAKQAMISLVNTINELNQERTSSQKIRLGLVRFSGTEIISQLTVNVNPLIDKINNLQVKEDTYTDMGNGLLKAQEVLRISPDSRKKAVIFYSDGMHNYQIDPTADKVLDFFRDKKIPIYSIGFGKPSASLSYGIDGAPPFDRTSAQHLACNTRFLKDKHLIARDDIISGETVYYCLIKDGVSNYIHPTNPKAGDPLEAWLGLVAYRLNAIAWETQGEYYHSPDAEDLQNVMQSIVEKTIYKSNIAIEIVEKYDSNYFSFENFDNLFFITHPTWKRMYDIGSLDGPGKYFVFQEEGTIKIFISSGSLGENEQAVVELNFLVKNARAENADACLDKESSEVKWGQIKGSEISQPVHQTSLPEYCFNIEALAGQGDVYFSKEPNFPIVSNLAVLGGDFKNIISNFASLKQYEFRAGSYSQKKKFQNEITNIINYLLEEKPERVKKREILDLTRIEKNNLYLAEKDLSINNSNSKDKIIGIVCKGGNITFQNVEKFYGVAVALPDENGEGGKIFLKNNDNSFDLYGTLVGKEFIKEGDFALNLFDPSENYFTKIIGLSPLLEKIYSYYQFK